MAANFIDSNPGQPLTARLHSGLRKIRDGLDELREWRAAFIQTRDGDGSEAGHYDLSATLGGYSPGDYASSAAAAKASFDEADSLYAKLSTDGSVSSVNAAILQACAKHGI